MIITKTPLRISFVGGGTDLEAFYKHQDGMVVSTAINKFIYIAAHKHYDGNRFLLKYSEIEEGKDINKIKNNIIRESMRLTEVSGVEIVSMSDAPGGAGLGSSSAFAVGLLNALYAYKGEYKTPEQLAQEACKIEIEILKKPIGKQDQYIAAYGGLRAITFKKNGEVRVEKIPLSDQKTKDLDSCLLLFSLDKTRSADKILSRQKANTQTKMESLIKMRNLARKMGSEFSKDYTDNFGNFLHQNWLQKKELAAGITDPRIDGFYQNALQAGALGGKVCGAGGGGFLLICCSYSRQKLVREALGQLKEMPFRFEASGTQIIHNSF